MRRSWSSLLGWLAMAALLVVAVATAGLGGTGSPDAPHPARPSGSPSGSPISARAAADVVRRVQLRRHDLPPRFAPLVTRTRNERDAEDSLRLCGALLPRDLLRFAGDRAVFTDPRGERVRTEVAVYRPGGAGAAVRALQTAPASCARPVAPGRVELPSTLALRVLTGDAPDRTRHELVVLRRGEVVVLLAVDAPPAPGARLVLRLARTLAARLQSWPPGRVT